MAIGADAPEVVSVDNITIYALDGSVSQNITVSFLSDGTRVVEGQETFDNSSITLQNRAAPIKGKRFVNPDDGSDNPSPNTDGGLDYHCWASTTAICYNK